MAAVLKLKLKMSDTVFILGAGASKEAGAPLMGEFLDTAHRLWRSNSVGELGDQFPIVFDAISLLQAVHSKSQLDINNIESFFSTCEMAKTLGTFPKKPPDEIDDLLRALKLVIVTTLERMVRFPAASRARVKAANRAVDAPEPYGQFVDLLKELRQKSNPSHSTGVLTFNYDIALDYALFEKQIPVDYAVENNGHPQPQSIPLLKLHGSLNWTETNPTKVTERGVVVCPMDKCLTFDAPPPETPGAPCTLPIRQRLYEMAQRDGCVTGEPVIVPPTWNKADSHRSLSRVWSRAALELSQAENIIVIGYSMPETDAFFRYLYALGTVGPVLLKRFWVFDPDTTGVVKERFENLLGHGAKPRFQYFPRTFDAAIGILKSKLARG